jgi:carboxylesterase type B
MSVAALLGAPRARPLFRRAICQSGAAGNVMSQQEANGVAETFLEVLGGPARTPEALGRIPVEQILRAQGVVNRRLARLDNLMVFVPCADGDLIPEQPIEAVRRGETRHLSLMVGTTLDEWKLFTALDSGLGPLRGNLLVERMRMLLPKVTSRAPDPPRAAWQYREAVRARGGRTSALEVWSAFQSARVFHYPASLLAEAQAQAGGDAYAYLFTWRPPALRRAIGAFHAIDVPFVFGLDNHRVTRPLAGLANGANRLSHSMQDAWAAFAHEGDPGHDELPSWERYGNDARATMVLGRRSYLADAPLEPERSLWERWI